MGIYNKLNVSGRNIFILHMKYYVSCDLKLFIRLEHVTFSQKTVNLSFIYILLADPEGGSGG